MSSKLNSYFFLLLFPAIPLMAQKPFTEGYIIYNIKLQSADRKIFTGTYTFTFKGSQLRKELKLNNGYQDVVLYNCTTNTVYSLQNRNNRKYAIELSMPDLLKKQEKYRGFTISGEKNNPDKILESPVFKGTVSYRDGSNTIVVYTKDWYPSQAITFERYPGALFFPLSFSYTDDDGISMQFDAAKFEPGPVENAVFRIPAGYRTISNKEYMELSR